MSSYYLLSFLFFCTLTKFSQSFLPNQFSPNVKATDYTHADITEAGILQAVAAFFETVPAPGKTKVAPDTLTGITDLTTRKLYDAYYGTTTSDVPFQNAIDDIIRYNNKVDQDHQNEAAWHFNGEQINEANQKLIQLRDNLLSELKSASPVYETAREYIGQFFHIMQMFYSNTNWINLHKSEIYPDLGISGKSLLPVAPKTLDMCKSCGLKGPGISRILPCSNMAHIKHSTTYLTSGYRSGQDIQKPYKDPLSVSTGKCSHGGSSDTSGNTSAALGGINKETSDKTYSPEFLYHAYAAKQAINHTKYFLMDSANGILPKIGKDKAIELLQLQPAPSLVFVVDTTTNMDQEIQAIRDKTKAIVQATNGTVNQPYNYILVTFNDPGTLTKLQKTKDASQMMTWLNNIKAGDANAGNDCPEFSLTGLTEASAVASYNSRIYLFTDAPPKDPSKINFITSLMTERGLKIYFFISGQCNRRKRSTGQRKRYAGIFRYLDAKKLIRT